MNEETWMGVFILYERRKKFSGWKRATDAEFAVHKLIEGRARARASRFTRLIAVLVPKS